MSGELFFDGFEQFFRARYLKPELSSADYEFKGREPSLGAGRIGGSAIYTGGGSLVRSFPWRTDKVSVGFACKMDTRGGFVEINGLSFALDYDQGRVVADGDEELVGGAAPVMGRWYYYEVTMEKSTGEVELYINNKLDLSFIIEESFPGVTSVEVSLNAYWAPRRVLGDIFGRNPGPLYQDNGTRVYDDFYIYEGDRLTPVQITTKLPSEDVEVEWEPSMEGRENWWHVGDTMIDPLNKHVMSNVHLAKDVYISEMKLPDTNRVIAMGAVGAVRKTVSGPGTIDFNVGPYSENVDNIDNFWRYRYRAWLTPEETPGAVDGYDLGFTADFTGLDNA